MFEQKVNIRIKASSASHCSQLYKSRAVSQRVGEEKPETDTQYSTTGLCRGHRSLQGEILSSLSLFLLLSHISLSLHLSLSVSVIPSLPLSPVIDRCIRASLLSVQLQFHLICPIHYAAFRLSLISKHWLKLIEKWDLILVISLRRRSSEWDKVLEAKCKEKKEDIIGWHIVSVWNYNSKNWSAQTISVASGADGVCWAHRVRVVSKLSNHIEGRKLNYWWQQRSQFVSVHINSDISETQHLLIQLLLRLMNSTTHLQDQSAWQLKTERPINVFQRQKTSTSASATVTHQQK